MATSLSAGGSGSVTTAVALKKGHAAKAAAGAPASRASARPLWESGQPGASAGCAQPPGRNRQERRGSVLEGVAVSVAVAVAGALPVGREEAEGDAVEEPEGDAVRVAAPAVGDSCGESIAESEVVTQAEGGSDGEALADVVPGGEGDVACEGVSSAVAEGGGDAERAALGEGSADSLPGCVVAEMASLWEAVSVGVPLREAHGEGVPEVAAVGESPADGEPAIADADCGGEAEGGTEAVREAVDDEEGGALLVAGLRDALSEAHVLAEGRPVTEDEAAPDSEAVPHEVAEVVEEAVGDDSAEPLTVAVGVPVSV